MVEIINRNIQLGSESVLIPCVVADLRDEVHASWMDDDFQVLNPLNAVLDAVLALCRSLDTKAKAFQFVN